jgi:hypothetical protein
MEGTGLYATPTSAIVRYPPPDILVAAIAVYLIIVYNKELFLWTIASFKFRILETQGSSTKRPFVNNKYTF